MKRQWLGEACSHGFIIIDPIICSTIGKYVRVAFLLAQGNSCFGMKATEKTELMGLKIYFQ